MLKFLVIAGADVRVKNQSGQTPLHTAVLTYRPASEIQFLLQSGGLVNEVDFNGNALIHYAIQLSTSPDLIELLKNSGANLEIKNSEGETPLHLAVSKATDNIPLVKCLLLHGADVRALDKDRNTPLHRALMNNPIPETIVSLLINKGADIEAMNSLGVTCSGLILFAPKTQSDMDDLIEVSYRILLANSFGIPKESFEYKGQEVSLRGGAKDQGVGHTLRLLDLFEKDPANQPFADMINLYKSGVKNGKLPPATFKRKFRTGEPFSITAGFMTSGSRRHLIEITIYKDLLVICNRGAGAKSSSSVLYKINRNSNTLNEDLIASLQLGRVSTDEADHFFYKHLL